MVIDLKKTKRIHLVGIKGVGMSALALMLKGRRFEVTGSDVTEEFITDKNLRAAQIPVRPFGASNISSSIDLVITTPAWGKTNPEVAAAQKTGIPVVSGATLLGLLMDQSRGLVVTGTHGKTTTTATLAFVFKKMGLDPSFFIGTGKIFGLEANGHTGRGEFLIAEGDEYKTAAEGNRPKFMELRPEMVILTSVEMDHPDVFHSLGDVKKAFRDFMKNIRPSGFIAACGDDPAVREVTAKVPQAKVEYYGLGGDNDWQAVDLVYREQSTDFNIHYRGESLGWFSVQLAGQHSVLNTLGVIAICRHLNLDLDRVKQALKEFIGSERRLEYKGEKDGVLVYDDYAHHPTAIRTTLEGLQARFPKKKIWCVFQPHTFSRTKVLLGDFAVSFNAASHVLLTEIWGSAREKKGNISSRDIVKRGSEQHPDMRFCPNMSDAQKILEAEVQKDEIIVTMGAGDIYHLGESYLASQKSKIKDQK